MWIEKQKSNHTKSNKAVIYYVNVEPKRKKNRLTHQTQSNNVQRRPRTVDFNFNKHKFYQPFERFFLIIREKSRTHGIISKFKRAIRFWTL